MKKSSKIILGIVIILFITAIGVGAWMIIDNQKKSDLKISELENQISSMNNNESALNTDDNNNSGNASKKQNNDVSTNQVNDKNNNTTTLNNNSAASKKAFSEDDLVIESFRLGESAKALDSAYPNIEPETKYYTEDATGYDISELNYSSLGLKVDNASLINEDDGDGSMIRIEIYGNSSIKTARGIKIGSSKEDVLNAYPSNSILKSDMVDENKTIIVGYPGSEPVYGSEKGNIYYDLENGKVSRILLAYAVAE